VSWMPRKVVVVPVDFSDDSFDALKTARDLVAVDGEVRVVHVLPIIEPAEPGIIWDTVDDESRSRHAEEALRQKLEERDEHNLKIAIRFGDPSHEIAEYVGESEADLVVLPSHGSSGFRRLLLGSVAERVVRLVHCPVLVLKKTVK